MKCCISDSLLMTPIRTRVWDSLAFSVAETCMVYSSRGETLIWNSLQSWLYKNILGKRHRKLYGNISSRRLRLDMVALCKAVKRGKFGFPGLDYNGTNGFFRIAKII